MQPQTSSSNESRREERQFTEQQRKSLGKAALILRELAKRGDKKA